MHYGKLDEKFVSLFKKGDRKAFEVIYDLFSPRVIRIAELITGDAREADDITNTAFIRLFENRSKFEYPGEVLNYLKKIVRNESFNYLKYKKNVVPLSEEKLEKVIEEDLDDFEIYDKLVAILNQNFQCLSAKQKQVLYLYFYKGLQSKEIGEILNLSDFNVRKIKERALKKLRDPDLLKGNYLFCLAILAFNF